MKNKNTKYYKQTKDFCVYKLKLKDNSVYIGATSNFPKRMDQHRRKFIGTKKEVIICGIVDEFNSIEDCSMMEQFYIKNTINTINSDKSPEYYKTKIINYNVENIMNNPLEGSSVGAKGGFNMIYHKSYEQITEEAIKSNKDLKLFNWITNRFTYNKVEVPLVFTECPIDVSQPQFSRMIKQLNELDYIMRISRGIYRLNPFIYVPFRAPAEELQSEWETLKKFKTHKA